MQIEMTRQGRPSGSTAAFCARRVAGIARMLSAVIVLCFCAAAPAVEMTSLYTVQVPLESNDPDSRNFAFQAALTEVLVRVTGTTAVVDSEEIAQLFPDPGRYVQRFYPGPDNTLVVSLDGPTIENVLRQTGANVWGTDRPLTLIWLAVDWGQGEREIVAADNPERMSADARSIDRNRLLRERVAEVASHRGIPVLFPLLDTEDLENISFSDIWGGFDDLLLQASARYEAESVLLGRIRPDSLQPNRWTWYHAGESAGWDGEPEDMIHLLADSLAAQYAVSGRAPVDTVRLIISGINSVSAFGRVQHFMENLRGIDALMIDTVAGDRIIYEVEIQGGTERLQRTLELSNMLEAVDPYNEGVEVVPFDDDENPYRRYDRNVPQRNTLEFFYRSD
jgi:hypothetical protein